MASCDKLYRPADARLLAIRCGGDPSALWQVFEERCLQVSGTHVNIDRFVTPSPRGTPDLECADRSGAGGDGAAASQAVSASTHSVLQAAASSPLGARIGNQTGEIPGDNDLFELEPFQTVLSLLRDAAAVFRSRQLRPGASDGPRGLELDAAVLFGTVDAAMVPSVGEVGELNDLMDDGAVQVQEAVMLCVSRLCSTRGWPALAPFVMCGLVDEVLISICLSSGSAAREVVAAKAADVLTSVLEVLCLETTAESPPRERAAQRLAAERIAVAGIPVLVATLCSCIETGRVGLLALSAARACKAAANVPSSVYVGGETMQARLVALLAQHHRVVTVLGVTAGTPLGMQMVGECHALLQALLTAEPGADLALFDDILAVARLVNQLVTGLCVQRRRAVETLTALCQSPAGMQRVLNSMIPSLGPALLHALANPICGLLRAECCSLLHSLLSSTMRPRERKPGSVTERHMLVLRVVTMKSLAQAAAAALRLSAGSPEVLRPKLQLIHQLCNLDLDGRLV